MQLIVLHTYTVKVEIFTLHLFLRFLEEDFPVVNHFPLNGGLLWGGLPTGPEDGQHVSVGQLYHVTKASEYVHFVLWSM